MGTCPLGFWPLPLTSEALILLPIPRTQYHVPEGPHAGIDACLHTVHILQEVLSKPGEEAERLTGLIEQERAKNVADADSGLFCAQHTMTSSKEEVFALDTLCLAHHQCIAASPQHEKSNTMYAPTHSVRYDL